MDSDLQKKCQTLGISIYKANGEPYAISTLKKKCSEAVAKITAPPSAKPATSPSAKPAPAKSAQTGRKSPAISATILPIGTEQIGLDGEWYIIKQRENKSQYWAKCSIKTVNCKNQPKNNSSVTPVKQSKLKTPVQHCISYNITLPEADEGDYESCTPEEFIAKFGLDAKNQKIIRNLQEGNCIDTEDYRGTGVWYFDGYQLHKSLGEYGYTLPSEAYKMVEKYGLEYFGDYATGCELVELPSGLSIIVNGQSLTTDGSEALSIRNDEEGDDIIKIGQKTYKTTFYEIYP